MKLSHKSNTKQIDLEIGDAVLITASACFFTALTLMSAWRHFNHK